MHSAQGWAIFRGDQCCQPNYICAIQSMALWMLVLLIVNVLLAGVMLHQNMRQRGDESWASHLNALRDCQDAQAVETAIDALRGRLAMSNGGPVDDTATEWANTTRLYARTRDVVRHNEARLQQAELSGARVYDIAATHTLLNEHGIAQQGPVPAVLIPTNADECGGLQAKLRLCVGARVILRRNVLTEDGLVNGAQGAVTGFKFGDPPRPDAQAPIAAVLIQFDNPRVGREYRRSMNLDPDSSEPVAVEPTLSSFHAKGSTMRMQRLQYPLDLAWALTIHRVQGVSLDRAVIDLGSSIFAAGQAYVALSRVRSLAGVLLLKLDPQKVQMVDPRVPAEYARLGMMPAATDLDLSDGVEYSPALGDLELPQGQLIEYN